MTIMNEFDGLAEWLKEAKRRRSLASFYGEDSYMLTHLARLA